MSTLPTPIAISTVAGVALLVSALTTALVRRYALATNLMDVPNERSSHRAPTPRGGGLGIVAGVLAGLLAAGAMLHPPGQGGIAWLAPALIVALAGFIDDRQGLSARARLLVHVIAALIAIEVTGVPVVPMPGGVVGLGMAGLVVALGALVWSTNLFNFMDGIDGIAGVQAVQVFGAAAVLLALTDAAGGLVLQCLVLACAAAGFLLWNWPPAKIFMGDVGSGFLGFALGALAFMSSGSGGVSVWTWIVLDGVFLVDATVTLATRILAGKTFYQAHRSHVYQRLSRRARAHRPVVLGVMAVNGLWLLPLAIATVRAPSWAIVVAAIALLPLATAAIVLGAGRTDPD